MDIVKRDYEKQIKTADFLQRRESWRGDIITNPPYKYAAEFVQHALDIIDNGQKVAMFLKLTFLEGEKRRAPDPYSLRSLHSKSKSGTGLRRIYDK